MYQFGIFRIVHCDLFEICFLLFVILIINYPQEADYVPNLKLPLKIYHPNPQPNSKLPSQNYRKGSLQNLFQILYKKTDGLQLD